MTNITNISNIINMSNINLQANDLVIFHNPRDHYYGIEALLVNLYPANYTDANAEYLCDLQFLNAKESESALSTFVFAISVNRLRKSVQEES